jgi:transposase InsO family protein
MALHRRLGHAGKCTMGKVIAQGKGGVVRASDLKAFKCPACIKGKGTKLPSRLNNPNIKRATSPLARILADIWGPARIPSAGGATYSVTIIDDYSQCVNIRRIKHKSEAFSAVQKYIARWENQLGCEVKVLRTDGGAEFGANPNGSDAPKAYLAEKRIVHTVVLPGNHAQNGQVERLHRTIFNSVIP